MAIVVFHFSHRGRVLNITTFTLIKFSLLAFPQNGFCHQHPACFSTFMTVSNFVDVSQPSPRKRNMSSAREKFQSNWERSDKTH